MGVHIGKTCTSRIDKAKVFARARHTCQQPWRGMTENLDLDLDLDPDWHCTTRAAAFTWLIGCIYSSILIFSLQILFVIVRPCPRTFLPSLASPRCVLSTSTFSDSLSPHITPYTSLQTAFTTNNETSNPLHHPPPPQQHQQSAHPPRLRHAATKI